MSLLQYLSSFSLFSIALAILILIITKQLINQIISYFRLPPGPIGLPLFGYLPFLTRTPHTQFLELSKKYGAVFSFRLGPSNVVVLNRWAAIKEALSKDEILGRPHFLKSFDLPVSILDGNGALWKEQRRFALQHLRDHGFGKTTMEEKIREEISYLLKEIEKHCSKGPVNIHDLITPSVSNNVCILIFNKRFDYDDKDRRMLDNALNKLPRLLQLTGLQVVFPSLVNILFKLRIGRFGQIGELFGDMVRFVTKQVDEHHRTLDPDRPRDYIDSYLIEYQNRLGADQHGQVGTFTYKRLIENSRLFFGAGSETVRTTTDWAMILIAKHPEIQDRVQAELDEVVGQERQVNWADRLSLPYTQAVLFEIQRWASVVPLNVPRMAMEDVHIGGKLIPAGTRIFMNLWSVHHDPEHFPDPELFDPNRFFESGKLIRRDQLIPFSAGKRDCAGKGLAEVELFLYFASILQNYRVNPVNDQAISLEKTLGTTFAPVQMPVFNFIKRY